MMKQLGKASGEAQKRTSLQRAQELRQARERIAMAIEQGDVLQFKAGLLEVQPRQVRSPSQSLGSRAKTGGWALSG